MSIDLHGRRFVPVENSKDGAVSAGTIFTFSQNGNRFTADYDGAGIEDGHIIGKMTSTTKAELLYHCRTHADELSAGQAEAVFSRDTDGALLIHMTWQWLNGSQTSGTSRYKEIMP